MSAPARAALASGSPELRDGRADARTRRLGIRRIYILPVRMGWFFAATVLILLMGSINYALSLGFALTFVVAGIGIAGMVHTVRNLIDLEIAAGRSPAVFAGEQAQFRLHVNAPAGPPRIAILARLAEGSQLVFDCESGGSAEVVLSQFAPARGWMKPSVLHLETRFPLGFFRAWTRLQLDAELLVYPRPVRSALPPLQSDAAGGSAPRSSAGHDDYGGLRRFQPEDSPRHVAWKAYAQTGEMLTKQFAGESSARLWLDWSKVPRHLDTEARLSRLTGWVLAAEDAGLRYGLRLPGVAFGPDRGERHRESCLRALALFAPGPATGALSPPRSGRPSP